MNGAREYRTGDQHLPEIARADYRPLCFTTMQQLADDDEQHWKMIEQVGTGQQRHDLTCGMAQATHVGRPMPPEPVAAHESCGKHDLPPAEINLVRKPRKRVAQTVIPTNPTDGDAD